MVIDLPGGMEFGRGGWSGGGISFTGIWIAAEAGNAFILERFLLE
jgi:hypothetical protein